MKSSEKSEKELSTKEYLKDTAFWITLLLAGVFGVTALILLLTLLLSLTL